MSLTVPNTGDRTTPHEFSFGRERRRDLWTCEYCDSMVANCARHALWHFLNRHLSVELKSNANRLVAGWNYKHHRAVDILFDEKSRLVAVERDW